MDKPYKFELGEFYWWTKAEKRVLLQDAICKYNEHGLDTIFYILEKVDGYHVTIEEQELIGQLKKTNTEPLSEDRASDLAEQVKSFLEQAKVRWDRPIDLCSNCGLPKDFEPTTFDLMYLVDLQKALRAYLREENP